MAISDPDPKIDVCLPLPPSGDHQQQWDYILSNFSVRNIYVLGDPKNAPTTNVFKDAIYIESCQDLPDIERIVLSPSGGRYVQGLVDLADFVHPVEAVYVFGADNVPLSSDEIADARIDHHVFISTDTHDELYSWMAYAVTRWDRRMKNG